VSISAIRNSAAVLALLAVAGVGLLCGLLTNWFRYELSLEATVVLVAAVAGVVVVACIAWLTYRRGSAAALRLAAVALVMAAGLVLVVHDQALGGLPRFYLAHSEKSPPALLQTPMGPIRYWIELENPFAKRHAEFLVLDSGRMVRVPLELDFDPAAGFASAVVPGDWGTLTATAEADVATLTLGRFLSRSGEQFRVELKTGTARRLR
jgi:hypothetical protein